MSHPVSLSLAQPNRQYIRHRTGRQAKYATHIHTIHTMTTYVGQPSAIGYSAFDPFGVDKLSSEQLYRMCAGRAI